MKASIGGLAVVATCALCACDDGATPAEGNIDVQSLLGTRDEDSGQATDSSTGDDAGSAQDSGETPSCATGEVDCNGVCIPAIEPTAEDISTKIFARSCGLSSSCHASDEGKEGLSLGTLDGVFETAVGKPSAQRPELPLIAPGDATGSYLIHKLRDIDIAAQGSTGVTATPMPPPPSDALCEAKLLALEAWIDAGALR